MSVPLILCFPHGSRLTGSHAERYMSRLFLQQLVLLFTSLLAIPLPCKRCFYALLLTGLQVVGVTLDFFDDVFLLNLTLEPAQCIFERLAFLYTNLCQVYPPPNLPMWQSQEYLTRLSSSYSKTNFTGITSGEIADSPFENPPLGTPRTRSAQKLHNFQFKNRPPLHPNLSERQASLREPILRADLPLLQVCVSAGGVRTT
jgi:hypothetical protein